uniref:Uncharacterized protein n=1 Tax=Oryza meridionalis TaxID=40149 RepID=A0A0E0D4R4_9ORYZ
MAASFHAALLLLFFLLGLAGHWEEATTTAPLFPWRMYGVSMKGADGDVVHLAVHKHDYSFAGFANRSGHWHVFPGDDEAAVLPDDARRLPFRNTYRDLIGGLENVPGLPLDREGGLAARHPGRRRRRRGGAARLEPIRETVDGGWESGDGEARVAAEHLPYIEHWDTMSFELLRWRRAGEALAVARVIANRSFVQLLRAHSHGA